MKRYIYLILGSLAMCVYGLMYNWTVFSTAVQADLGVGTSSVAGVFSLCQIAFCVGGLISGFIYYHINFRFSMILAALLISTGLFVTSRATDITLIYISYGIIFNLGAGFGYKALLTAIITWFPDRPGLASGMLVMGTGLTAFVFNVPTALLIGSYGWRFTMSMVALIAGLCALTIAVIVVPNKQPMVMNNHETTGTAEVTTGQMLKKSSFYVYYAWSMLLLAGCSSLSGTAVNCGISFGISVTTAASLSMIISLSNSLSRVFYGYIYDKIGRKITMLIATSFFALAVTLLYGAFMLDNMVMLGSSFIFIGLTFGSVPTISSIYILKTFGAKNYPSNFSIQGTYSLFSSVMGTMLFSALFEFTGRYTAAYAYLPVYAVTAVLLYVTLNHILIPRPLVRE